MSFTRFHDDPCRIKKKLQLKTNNQFNNKINSNIGLSSLLSKLQNNNFTLYSSIKDQKFKNILLTINKDKLKLESLLRQSISLKRDKQKQMASLRKMRIRREKELNRIRQDKSALANYMQEKSAGVKQLESIIKKVLEDKARSEREERIRQQQQAYF